jgi:tRNA(Arg) A34 adenosine deaminase TadA
MSSLNNTNNNQSKESLTPRDTDRDPKLETYFMKQALKIAKRALDIGEVPVGCVIVLRKYMEIQDEENSGIKSDSNIHYKGCQITKKNYESSSDNVNDKDQLDEESSLERYYMSSPQVIVSHGANQVNATRDATRHAECIAIDRMLTGGLTSDKMRLPQHIFIKKLIQVRDHDVSLNNKNEDGGDKNNRHSHIYNDSWINVPSDPNHWKNRVGWGSNTLYKRDIFKDCDLYVTCEPCIMVSGKRY